MRDIQVHNLIRERDQEIDLLKRKVDFLATRMEAAEAIFQKPVNRFRALISFKWAKDKVDTYQVALMASISKSKEAIKDA